jgi:hypothetical protein
VPLLASSMPIPTPMPLPMSMPHRPPLFPDLSPAVLLSSLNLRVPPYPCR